MSIFRYFILCWFIMAFGCAEDEIINQRSLTQNVRQQADIQGAEIQENNGSSGDQNSATCPNAKFYDSEGADANLPPRCCRVLTVECHNSGMNNLKVFIP